MKKIIFILIASLLTSCSVDGTLNKIKKLDKAKCYDKESGSIKLFCKK